MFNLYCPSYVMDNYNLKLKILRIVIIKVTLKRLQFITTDLYEFNFVIETQYTCSFLMFVYS